MYVGLFIAYTGGVLITTNPWCLIILPIVVVTVHVFIIPKEEEYLEKEFGESYRDYRVKVRRWL
jgi:protein-S-isoprenylcysteine O-methyltransferase Ste14